MNGPLDTARGALAMGREQPRVLRQAAHRPWPLPRGPWVLAQTWLDTAFLHWPVDPERLRPALPPGLTLETWRDAAWVTVTPLAIRASRPRLVPPLLPSSAFPELNLRTYARVGDRPGIWFVSLDAGSPASVAAARTLFHLPYFTARIALGRAGDEARVRARRAARPWVAFSARARADGPAAPPAPGSLDEWLLERYCCYGADRRGGVWRTDIHHPPWPARPATAVVEHDTLTPPLGVAGPPALAHLADRQDVLFWPPRRAGHR
ncbi:YqjF family protein [Miltoncostaea marina]|uniref:YqjF family protein n=1 Tax=Miltoncostaea marina TaxID=2843215 RepID=UPI001C3D0636|nr:DUF2071 domain-containing protein [Miltoncostaea marina]